MDRRRLLVLGLLLLTQPAAAVQGGPVYTDAAPALTAGSACYIGRVRTDATAGKRWCCPAGTWVSCEPYDIHTFTSGLLASSQVLFRLQVPRSFSVPADCSLSRAGSGALATAPTVVSLQKNAVEFGTVTFASDGSATFTCASTTSFVAGDVLSAVGPSSADGTLADVSITLVGSL